MTDPLDLDQIRADAEAAAFAEAHGMSICPEISKHRENMDPPTTLAILDDLDRAEAALREIIDHPARDECEGDDLRSIARAALAIEETSDAD